MRKAKTEGRGNKEFCSWIAMAGQVLTGWRRPWLTALALLAVWASAKAQDSVNTHYLDLAGFQTVASLSREARFAAFRKNAVAEKDIPALDISQRIPEAYARKIPAPLVDQQIYLKFGLQNSGDSSLRFYFFPGLYCQHISLFKLNPDEKNPELIPITNPPGEKENLNGYIRTSLKAGERAIFYARLEFAFTPQNKFMPAIIPGGFMFYFKNHLISNKITLNIFDYVTAGILLMMIIYAVSTYFQDYQLEFLYYAQYAFCMAILLFLKSFLSGSTTAFNYFFEGYLDFFIQMMGYYFYILFIRKFLVTRRNHPWLDKFLAVSNIYLLTAMAAYTLLYFFTENYSLTHLAENITKQFLLFFSIVFILYGLWRKDPLMNYLVAGQLFLTLLAGMAFLMTLNNWRLTEPQGSVFNDPLLYYQAGTILDLVFFMSGLTYKNKRILTERVKERERLKLDNERKEFEKQVAILEAKQQERNRISADMHDELGSGVTAIRLMSEIVKAKMKDVTLPEIEKISHSADELLGKMNTIIWTMVSSNDTVESLVAYIRAYAVEFFENTAIQCRFELPDQMTSLSLSGDKRRSIFLAIKEALNNALKHSQATIVTITIFLENSLVIEVADNGVGIDLDQLRKFGNGLQNMKKRMVSAGGDFSIFNDQGTRTRFELPLDL